MLRFIFRNWRRHKERFLLLVIGAFIISAGLSYMLGLSETNKGTIIDSLQKRWRAPYDIVVRPKGSQSVTESKRLLEPNYLSEIPGGISLSQYDQIKKMKDVKVAAPIAMIGYLSYGVVFQNFLPKEPGVYRIDQIEESNDGATTSRNETHFYFSVGWTPSSIEDSRKTGLIVFDGKLQGSKTVLVAGIDPVQEAKLVGLSHAIMKDGLSRYLDEEDPVERLKDEYNERIRIPVLISNYDFGDEAIVYRFEKLSLPFATPRQVEQTIQSIADKGGEKYLETVKGEPVKTIKRTSHQIHEDVIKSLAGVDPKTGKKALRTMNVDLDSFLAVKPSAIEYTAVQSPFPDHWKFAYNILPHKTRSPLFPYGYRKPNVVDPDSSPIVSADWVGFYDPTQLRLPKDPLTELPMQTYRPPTAEWVLNAKNQPINPPKKVVATSNPFGFITQPPAMLTTLKAAAALSGDKPISAIRIKVAGVNELNEKSQSKLEKVAKEIEKRTGLAADITLGSSPQPAIVHVPKAGNQPEIGWIEELWVRLGASFTIFTQTRLGFTGIILAVILVAIAYVFATHFVSLLARRKQFAVLLAIGWRTGNLMKMVFLESMIIGLFVAVLSFLIEGWIVFRHASVLSPWRACIVGGLGFLIYFLGAIGPALLIRRINPNEAIKSGEIRAAGRRVVKARGPFTMAWNALAGKLYRNVLSVMAIAVPTMLLTLFLFVTFQLKGTLYTTWLGQYVALQVGPAHYIAMGVALGIAVLTTAEIMWQNVSERYGELALLKAVGWRDGRVGLWVVYEGFFVGVLSGLVGLLLALALIFFLYHRFPYGELWFILLTGLIPVAVGVLASLIPAGKAMRVPPVQGMRGPYHHVKG